MPVETMLLLNGLPWLLSQAATVVLIFTRLRRLPPVWETLARDYATKVELEKAKADWAATCRHNHDRADAQRVADLAGADKIESEQFLLIRSGQTEIRTLLQQFTREVSDWQRGVERQIGALDERTRNQ